MKTKFDDKLADIPFPNIKSAKEIVIAGNYGGGNLGDEAMLDVLAELIVQKLAEVKIIVPSRRPDVLRRLHPQPVIHSLSIIKGSLRALLCDVLILGGGTIFSRFSGPGIVLITLTAILRKLLLGKRTYFYAIGYSSSTPKYLSILARIAMKLADSVYVRDSISFSILEKFKIKSLSLVPELALFLQPSDIPLQLSNIKNDKGKYGIGISLMYISSADYDIIGNAIRGFIKYLYEANKASFWFLTFQPRVINYTPEWKSDDEISQMIIDDLPSDIKSSCHVMPVYAAPATLSIIKQLDLIVSMRYHCLIFAHLQQKPRIAISFEDKHKAFVNDYGGEIAELDHISAEDLISTWKKMKLL